MKEVRCLLEKEDYGIKVAVSVPETEAEREKRLQNMKREFETKERNPKRYYP